MTRSSKIINAEIQGAYGNNDRITRLIRQPSTMHNNPKRVWQDDSRRIADNTWKMGEAVGRDERKWRDVQKLRLNKAQTDRRKDSGMVRLPAEYRVGVH